MRGELFSIPIWHFSIPEFNSVEDVILNGVSKIREIDSGVQNSNYKGYQSKLLHEYAHIPEFFSLFSFIHSVSIPEIFDDINVSKTQYNISAWVNVNTKNCFNDIHNHLIDAKAAAREGRILILSGVFYVKCPPNSGNLVFRNNLINNLWGGLGVIERRNKYTSQSFSIEPSVGQIYIWPSYIWHMVFPNENDDERISIAFDIEVNV